MKIWSFFKVVVLIVLIYSCNNNNQNNTSDLPNSYTDSTIRLSVQYPANWSFDSASFRILEKKINDKDMFQESIVVGAELMSPSISLKDYAQSFITSYKILDTNCRILSNKSIIINNDSAFQVDFTTIQNQLRYSNQAVIFRKDTIGYFIQFNALDSSIASHLSIYNKIKNQIKTF
jgi:hypothetical protein